MRLSELIEENLNEIALGVKAAKEKSRSLIAISPGTVDDNFVAEITDIEFDVLIAVTEKSDKNSSKDKIAGGEIKVLSIGCISGKYSTKKGKCNSS